MLGCMNKQALLDTSNGIFLVQLNAAPRKVLVSNDLDAHQLWHILMSLSDRQAVNIIAYSFVEDSILLLYQSQSSPVAFVQNLISQYSEWHTRVKHKRGSVFSADYQFVLIEPEQSLIDALHLVHNFPVQKGLCASAATAPYSSYKGYLDPHQDMIVRYLAEPHIGQHETMFKRRFSELMDQDASYQTDQLLQGNHDKYLAYCSLQYLESLTHPEADQTHQLELNDVIEFVCSIYHFKPIQLETQKRHRLIPELKGLICYLCDYYHVSNQKQLKQMLNMDDFDIERGLRLVQMLPDTDLFKYRMDFEQAFLTEALMDLEEDTSTADTQITESDEEHPNIHLVVAEQEESAAKQENNNEVKTL